MILHGHVWCSSVINIQTVREILVLKQLSNGLTNFKDSFTRQIEKMQVERYRRMDGSLKKDWNKT